MEPWFGEEEKCALIAYMESGGWLTEFQETRKFEEMLAEYVDSRYCVVTPNGTLALVLALMALEVGPGDEVIVPDYTMIASANSVVLAGATPKFVDIDPSTLCLDLTQIEQAITPRTAAVMLVSLNGRSPDMSSLVALCQSHDVALFEDAAQSLGSRFGGKHLGTFGALGCFSFSAPKVISTGQGGAAVTDDPKLFERLRLIKDFGRAQPGRDCHEAMGFNFKFTDLQAVVGIEQMRKLSWRVARKKEIYSLYQEFLADREEIQFIPTNLEDTSPWFIEILVDSGKRDHLVEFLKKRGVGSRPFYPAIHTQSPYADTTGNFPHALDVSQRGLWLPSSSFLTNQEIGHICQHIREFFDTG